MMASTTGAAGAIAPVPGPYFVSPSRPRIVLFGDSLTERSFDVPVGWGSCIAANYTRKADVVNRGCGGYNSRWGLQLLPYLLGPAAAPPLAAAAGAGGAAEVAAAVAGQVLFATLFFGANDAARMEGPSHSQRQHVPATEFGANLREMVSYLQAAGVARIAIITPPPVWDAGRKEHQIRRMGEEARDWPLDRTNEHTARYARTAVAVAADLGLPCLDLYTLLQQEKQWGERLFCDGLHFSPAGQERVWELLQGVLADAWPEARPEALASHFPAWDLIDADDPAATFKATAARPAP